MKKPLVREYRERLVRLFERLRSNIGPWREKLAGQLPGSSPMEVLSARVRGIFRKERPPLEITSIQSPTLIVMMAGTLVQQYEQAGQLGRLAASLERHTKYFRTVLLMSTDRTDYTPQLQSDRVRHVRAPFFVPPFLSGGAALAMSTALRFRTVRKATSVVILDEESAIAGWMASRLSRSCLSMSVGAPWAPPRHMDVMGKKRWLVRAALGRVSKTIQWPTAESETVVLGAETTVLSELVDTDLFCPLTTTDPTRPRAVGVFLGTENEADARVMLGVAERLARRKQKAVLSVFITGHGAESRASALRAEVSERDLAINFQVLPRIEMLPDAIARLRICVAFHNPASVQGLLWAMASGVPGIAVSQALQGDEADLPAWSRFVLVSSPTEEEIARNIETLFREPGVRLRMAREGRRFVIANHSLEALSDIESRHLLGSELLDKMNFAPEPEFDADAEAEKLAQMLEGLGVTRSDPGGGVDAEAAA